MIEKARHLVTVLGIALLASCSGGGDGGKTNPAVPQPTNTVTGTVTIKGAPMVGVTVVAFEGNTNTNYGVTTTDANGNYSFSAIPTWGNVALNIQFFASKPGYAFSPLMASNPSGSMAGYLFDSAPNNWYVNTGAAVTRAGFNGQFTNPSGGAGIAFNVINYMSTANNGITGANFKAYDGSNPLVSLAATGQATGYAAGDDGSLKKGVAWPLPRYVDNGNGTVADNLTGLTWLKNAGCFAPAVWATALANVNQLANGACGLTDGSTAGQWRLPNIVELESMVDASVSSPALPAGNPFINVSNGIYWTSTSYYGGTAGSPNAWAIRLSDGRYMNDSSLNIKASSTNAVWAVKGTGPGTVKLQATGAYVFFGTNDDGAVESGAPLPAPRMRDNGNGTVTDTATGLIWLKKADCINQTWAGAVAAVNALANGQCGLTDGSAAGSWRMPNRKEMQSLADRAQNNMAEYFNESFVSRNGSIDSQPAIFTNFVSLQYYWTSTTDAADTTKAWTVYSCDFGVYDISKAGTGYSLAVR